MIKYAFLGLFSLSCFSSMVGQSITVGSESDSRLRTAQLNSLVPVSWSMQVNPNYESLYLLKESGAELSNWAWIKDNPRRGFWIQPTPVISQSFYNSTFPFGWNDRAVWQGRGLTQSLRGGFRAGAGPVEAQIQPEYIWNQNSAYDTLGISNYKSRPTGLRAWQRHQSRIDNPFLYGEGSFNKLWAGQSYVKVNAWKFHAGISSENLWWGPGIHFALMMTNNAPGTPHVFLGTRAPIHTMVGSFEGRIISGFLHNSGQKLFPRIDQRRYMSAATFVYSPSFLPGLSVGAIRVFQTHEKNMDPGWRGYFPLFQSLTKVNFVTEDNPSGDDLSDQMASVTARWVMPESGAEFYGEFGRVDHSWDTRDLLGQPEHASGYMLGFRKDVLPSKKRSLITGIEFTKMEKTNTRVVRPSPNFYEHHLVSEGWTERGQIMGAGIGPGSNARVVNVLYVDSKTSAEFKLMHVAVNSSLYYESFVSTDYWRNWIDLVASASVSRRFGPLVASLSVGRVKSMNRYYLYKNDVKNYNAQFSIQYGI